MARSSLPTDDTAPYDLRIGIVGELARELSRGGVSPELWSHILDRTCELVRAERGVILVKENGAFSTRSTKHRKAVAAHEAVVIPEAILNTVIRHRQALLSSDATMDARLAGSSSIMMQGIRSVMCAPLLSGDELLGLFYLDTQAATRVFSDTELQLLSRIADLTALAVHQEHLTQKLHQQARTLAQCERLFPPALFTQLSQGRLNAQRTGELCEVTVLFCGLCNFTALCEAEEPTRVHSLLNEYFECLVPILSRWGGTLDKYVGDTIIGLFSAPGGDEEAPWRAVQCALEMRSALRDWNQAHAADLAKPFQLTIGINTGVVVAGFVGSAQAMQYTVLGNTVNTAARLCGLAKPDELLVGESTLAAVVGRVQMIPLPPTKLKGLEQLLRVYSIQGRA